MPGGKTSQSLLGGRVEPRRTKFVPLSPSLSLENKTHGTAKRPRGISVGQGRCPATASDFFRDGVASWLADSEVLPVVRLEGAFGEAGSAALPMMSGPVEGGQPARRKPVFASGARLLFLDGRIRPSRIVVVVLWLFRANALPRVVA
jgi:hypothetical protein